MKFEVKARIIKRRYQLSSLDESDVKICKDFDFISTRKKNVFLLPFAMYELCVLLYIIKGFSDEMKLFVKTLKIFLCEC